MSLDGGGSQALDDAEGRIELFGVNIAGEIFHRAQTSPGNWTGSGWSQLPGRLMTITAARNGDGPLEIFGTNAAGDVSTPGRRQQAAPGPAGTSSTATCARSPSRPTRTAGASWSSWSLLDGQLRS
jgi:hypothetical protein